MTRDGERPRGTALPPAQIYTPIDMQSPFESNSAYSELVRSELWGTWRGSPCACAVSCLLPCQRP